MAQPSISTKQSSGPLTQPSENQHMETRINLLKGDISYEEAAAFEYNVLPELTYPDKMSDFINYLLVHRREVEDIVSSYLGLTGIEKCCLAFHTNWMCGSFNLCLPVSIINWKRRPGGKVLVRFPLPFKTRRGRLSRQLRREAPFRGCYLCLDW